MYICINILNLYHLIDKIFQLNFTNSPFNVFSNRNVSKFLMKFDIFDCHNEFIPNLNNNEFVFFVIKKITRGVEPLYLNLQSKALPNMLRNHIVYFLKYDFLQPLCEILLINFIVKI